MSNFRVRLRGATEILATGEGDVKNRLGLAITEQLLFANFPDDPATPKYFRDKQAAIIAELSRKTWKSGLECDKVRATIHPMRFKTAASFAQRVWELYQEYEEYLCSGFIPNGR